MKKTIIILFSILCLSASITVAQVGTYSSIAAITSIECVQDTLDFWDDEISIRVAANGAVIAGEGASVNKVGTGYYEVIYDTPDLNAPNSILDAMCYEPYSSRDDIQAYIDPSSISIFGCVVYLVRQDNGQTEGDPVDNSFSFWQKKKRRVIFSKCE